MYHRLEVGWGLLRGRGGSSVPPEEPDPVGRYVTKRYDTYSRTEECATLPCLLNSYGCCSHGGGWDRVGQTNTESHLSDPTACLCSSQIVIPQNTIFSRPSYNRIPFLAMETVKVGEVSVPIYQFKQPERLSLFNYRSKLCCRKTFLRTMICTNLKLVKKGWTLGSLGINGPF